MHRADRVDLGSMGERVAARSERLQGAGPAGAAARKGAQLASLAVMACLASTLGCWPSPSEPWPDAAGDDTVVRAAVTLRVAVLGDDRLASAIERLRGEWAERTGGEVVVSRQGADASPPDEADLLVFPSRRLGGFCESGLLRRVRQSTLASETLALDGVLPLVREQEIVYGQRVMALPLGCPTPLRLQPAGIEQPESTKSPLPERPTEPDDRRLALEYLAWAAPHAVHRSRLATLFDADDFSPRVATPPFVRALEGFVAAEPAERTLIWPSRDTERSEASDPMPAPPPGADEAFNALSGRWEPSEGDDRHATLLASSGRLLSVTRTSRNAATAFRYAAWLAGPDNALGLSRASDGVANCRGSFARAPDAWFGNATREQAKAFAAAGAEALRRRRFLLAPRLPGADRYVVSLGAAVRRALAGKDPAAALADASSEWEAISVELGRDAQAAAHARSVNAEPLVAGSRG